MPIDDALIASTLWLAEHCQDQIKISVEAGEQELFSPLSILHEPIENLRGRDIICESTGYLS